MNEPRETITTAGYFSARSLEVTFGSTTFVWTLTLREPSTDSSERRSWLRSFAARTSRPVADGVGLTLPFARSSVASRAGRSICLLMRPTSRRIALRL